MIEGRQFLELAKELDKYEGESWDRTRIGRLYYGVYLEYRQFCEERLGFNRKNMAREHSAAIHLIATLNQEASNDLKELRLIRNQADYDVELSPQVIAVRARAAALLSSSLMEYLDTLRRGA